MCAPRHEPLLCSAVQFLPAMIASLPAELATTAAQHIAQTHPIAKAKVIAPPVAPQSCAQKMPEACCALASAPCLCALQPNRQPLCCNVHCVHDAHQQQCTQVPQCESRLTGAPVQATSAQHPRPTLRLLSATQSAATRTDEKQRSRTSPSESRSPGTQHADTTAPLMATKTARLRRRHARTQKQRA